jgi:hypothetical protein
MSIPFTAVAVETLNRIRTPSGSVNSPLLPKLYVGECPYGFYAVLSSVDESVMTIPSGGPRLPYLLEGPKKIMADEPSASSGSEHINPEKDSNSSNSAEVGSDFILLGLFSVLNLEFCFLHALHTYYNALVC